MQNQLPFTVSKTESFFDRLGEWIGDVFYDVLPEAGFELRDEQIYMAFQLEKAFKEKKVIFAEAGVGTGKTIVYLLYAVCYARYLNKPAIIACADETLIEQLVKKEGDIAKLEKALGMNFDVRLAKSRDQYLCLKKFDDVMRVDDSEDYDIVMDQLPAFVYSGSSMKSFEKYGDRKEYPHLSDEMWSKIGWDPLQDCFSCDKRHRCGQTLHRDFYRNSADLIICSHDFYMEHIWTKESRKREGQLPLLPDHSCVVFDEGHLLEFASQKALTYRFTEQTLDNLLSRLQENDVREKTLYTIEEALVENEKFFAFLARSASETFGSDKQRVEKTKQLLDQGKKLFWTLESLSEELVFDSELYVINDYELKIVEEYLEQISYSLSLFTKEMNGIIWYEEKNGERTLVIMPKMVEEIMREEVFSQNKPFIFSSATLSDKESFNYLAKSLGIDQFVSFSVASPFDYDENMKIKLPRFNENDVNGKNDYISEQIKNSNGRALVLLNDKKELLQLKNHLEELQFDFPIYYEGDAEVSTLVSNFQNNEDSVLCAINLWEGLDIPGRSLENVFIYSLPYPPNDPVFTAKREGSVDAFTEVDLPYMLLRLRQGIGRLIRTHEDQGTIHLLLEKELDPIVWEKISEILPTTPINQ
ncbi:MULTISPECIES: ATP-dependent DNA helicase [unclassified Bacillus (in: firmicutes)]|uniref:ATP-dependent DNA helicase n=1 Tax=unclassified Bacillus (in: firmicutes) TaxID=185979 RepID=UPI0008E6EACD|nr:MULTISPECIES: ATP-dependent DNA helicase [unclassified Bacillus (in: firmicutes)]SFA99139.1 ATP-dependent DNA helicase DinG [Bacillus sp. UNCCL13]SFQ81460.1 ATP-dependent DNA helicase DinG [Bacillus sp. cl95]